jgi:hypothetical protein
MLQITMHSATMHRLLLLLQGSSLIYAMLATMPEMNNKVSVVAHLGEYMLTVFRTNYRAC